MAKSKKLIDPEAQRFYRDFPKFPGVQTCVELLHRRNVRGTYLDCICAELAQNATEHSQELINVFHQEADERVRILLLAAIAEANSEEFIPILEEQLTGDEAGLRRYAAYGLAKLDTKESRRILWQARTYEFQNPEETVAFQQMLDQINSLWPVS